MNLTEFAQMLGLSIADINIIPLTGEEILAIDQGMLEAALEEDEDIERQYKYYLESQYYSLECQGQY